jgi:hypothetical protein
MVKPRVVETDEGIQGEFNPPTHAGRSDIGVDFLLLLVEEWSCTSPFRPPPLCFRVRKLVMVLL